jgi:hypothetical protein
MPTAEDAVTANGVMDSHKPRGGAVRPWVVLGRLLLALIGLSAGAGMASAAAAAVMKPRRPDRTTPEDAVVDLVAIYGSRDLRSISTAFGGGRLICWYAGTDLDLRGARLNVAGGELVVWTVFGATGIQVPEDWRVVSRGITVFGAVVSPAAPPDAGFNGPVLVIRHRTIFGALSVVAEPEDEVLDV